MKAECGSSRCRCDHTLCEYGWFTVPQRLPNGEWSEAATKCLHCFPPAEPVEADPTGRPIRKRHHDARDLGADYADHARAAAGDRE